MSLLYEISTVFKENVNKIQHIYINAANCLLTETFKFEFDLSAMEKCALSVLMLHYCCFHLLFILDAVLCLQK